MVYKQMSFIFPKHLNADMFTDVRFSKCRNRHLTLNTINVDPDSLSKFFLALILPILTEHQQPPTTNLVLLKNETRANESLDKRVAELKEALPKLNVRTSIRHGEAHEATLECAKAEAADMIVLGTHGHTGITHALLGSTAEKVVRLASCPVTTVRTPE